LDNEVRAQIDLQFNAPKLLKLQGLFLHDAASAQSFLLSFETLHEIEHDLLHRSDKAEAGSPTLHAQVRQEVAQIRVAALKQTANEASEFASWTMVKECCEHLQWKKAAVRLPRASLRFQTDQGFLVIWVLVNLVANMCLTPSSWLREVTAIRKKGPMKVSNLNNLRPVSYTCPLGCTLMPVGFGEINRNWTSIWEHINTVDAWML